MTAGDNADVKLCRTVKDIDSQLPQRMRQISADPSFMGRKR